jgi:hypothetical protein
MLTTDQNVSFHMKLPPLQDNSFVHFLPCASFRRRPKIVLTTDQSVPFHKKLPLYRIVVFFMFCHVILSEEDLRLC